MTVILHPRTFIFIYLLLIDCGLEIMRFYRFTVELQQNPQN